MKSLCFGEILFDRIDDDYFGGYPANIASSLSRFEIESYMLSTLVADFVVAHSGATPMLDKPIVSTPAE